MENIKTSVKGTILTITVDLSKKGSPSGTGKSIIIATTSGNVTLDGAKGEVKMGLNIYRKNPDYVKPEKD